MEEDQFKNLFLDYIEIYDRIYDLTPDETLQLAEDLIKICSERAWDTSTILLIISNAAECNLVHLREYWEIFKRIYYQFQIRPSPVMLKPHIAVLYSKEYQIRLQIKNLPDHLKNYEEMEIENILNVYEPLSIMHCILHHDIDNFVQLFPIPDDEKFNQKIEDKTLIEWCCYYGAMECFKFLRMNKVEITKECLEYSLIGKNEDILVECLAEVGNELKSTGNISILLQINDANYIYSLHKDYKVAWNIDDASLALNLHAYLLLMGMRDRCDMAFMGACIFGITDVIPNAAIAKNINGLLAAAANNNVNSIIKLMELGVNIEAKNEKGFIALMGAAQTNSIESIEKLIELGANIDEQDFGGNTALHIASVNNRVESVAKLIELGACIESKNQKGETALILAAKYNSIDSIIKLVELGADIEAKTIEGVTALMIAAYRNNIKSIIKLIDLGANIDAKNDEGITALIFAARYNRIDSITKLVELGANIEATYRDGITSFMAAAEHDNIDAVAKLIELNANIEARDDFGFTVLMCAAHSNSVNSIVMLIESGANIEVKNVEGSTALHIAAAYNNVKSIIKLIELGANIEAKDNYGATPLNYASFGNHSESISKLIELGANLGTFNDESLQ